MLVMQLCSCITQLNSSMLSLQAWSDCVSDFNEPNWSTLPSDCSSPSVDGSLDAVTCRPHSVTTFANTLGNAMAGTAVATTNSGSVTEFSTN